MSDVRRRLSKLLGILADVLPLLPSMQDFEGELRKYMAVEQAVGAIPGSQPIGALCLDAAPLKAALKAEAASWKAQFARNLHAKGAADLRVWADVLVIALLSPLLACKPAL